jgi:hypothetical protein
LTKLYFRDTLNGGAGLPTNKQSSLTVDNNGDAVTVNRKLDTVIGSSQISKNCATNASSSTQVSRFTRFVSPVLGVTSIAANTWNYAFAVAEDNVNANFPTSTQNGRDIWVNVFVWNTTNSTKVGDIIDGLGGAGSEYQEPTTAAQETSVFGTFAGSAVNSIPAGSVICYEAIFQFQQNNATARTITLYYNGATETNNNGTTVSNHASYIETPQALTFSGGNVVKTIASTVTLSQTLARSKGRKVAPTAAETVTVSSTPTIRRTKNRALAAETVTVSTDAASPSFIKAHNINKPLTETVTVSSTASFTRMRNRASSDLVHITDSVDYLQHPKKFHALLTETVLLHQTASRTSGKKRTVLN